MAPALTPVPVRVTLCGEPAAESLMSSAPLRVPVAVGVKLTAALQLTPAAKDEPQVVVI